MDDKPEVEKQVYQITGMDCADCARTVEIGVAQLDGVVTCKINFAASRLQVEGDVAPETIQARIKALGYGVADQGAHDGSDPWYLAHLPANGAAGFLRFLLGRRDTLFALVAALLILPGLIFGELLPMLDVHSPVFDLMSLAALVLAGYPIVRSAWRSLAISHRITINLLMTIAAGGAVIIGAYSEAGLVMVLFAIGEALEGYTMEQARTSIRSLLSVSPNTAVVLRPCIDCAGHLGMGGYVGGPCPFCGVEEQLVPVDDLIIGDRMVVKPGERIAMDGRVAVGLSAVNQSPITGESVPVDKGADDVVFAGSINGEGALEVEITQLAADNTLNRIIRLVEDAQEHKAPAERFVDEFARWYTPAVVILAGLVAVLPPLLLGVSFWGSQGSFYRALELLVIACPCALVISTPVTVISAISNAAHNGILIKGGAYLERLAAIGAVALDKTGTLTLGAPAVVAYRAVNCENPSGDCSRCDDLLALACAVERRSEHPLAQAIVQASADRGLLARYPVADAVTSMPGKGVSGAVNGRTVIVGSHGFFDASVAHPPSVCDEIEDVSRRGLTPMLIGADGEYRGYAVVADTLRPSSKAALASLRAAGVKRVVMVTGDNFATARRIADDVGVDAVYAGLLPEQKAEVVHSLIAEYGAVAMVGDGINDAPALAVATVGIAMGAGTAQALETANVALMGDDLGKLSYALRLSRAALSTIRFNIALSIGVKAIFMGIVLLGYGNLWLAVLADVGTALVVTLNGMRLLHFRMRA